MKHKKIPHVKNKMRHDQTPPEHKAPEAEAFIKEIEKTVEKPKKKKGLTSLEMNEAHAAVCGVSHPKEKHVDDAARAAHVESAKNL